MNAKRVLIILSILIAFCIFLTATGRCAIPKGTPGGVLCKADMDGPTCKKFQTLLRQYGHQMVVMEGVAYATVKQAKENTFVAVLKCRDCHGNIYVVGVYYLKDNFQRIEIQATGEKVTEM